MKIFYSYILKVNLLILALMQFTSAVASAGGGNECDVALSEAEKIAKILQKDSIYDDLALINPKLIQQTAKFDSEYELLNREQEDRRSDLLQFVSTKKTHYILLDPTTGKIIFERKIDFDSSDFIIQNKHSAALTFYHQGTSVSYAVNLDHFTVQPVPVDEGLPLDSMEVFQILDNRDELRFQLRYFGDYAYLYDINTNISRKIKFKLPKGFNLIGLESSTLGAGKENEVILKANLTASTQPNVEAAEMHHLFYTLDLSGNGSIKQLALDSDYALLSSEYVYRRMAVGKNGGYEVKNLKTQKVQKYEFSSGLNNTQTSFSLTQEHFLVASESTDVLKNHVIINLKTSQQIKVSVDGAIMWVDPEMKWVLINSYSDNSFIVFEVASQTRYSFPLNEATYFKMNPDDVVFKNGRIAVRKYSDEYFGGRSFEFSNFLIFDSNSKSFLEEVDAGFKGSLKTVAKKNKNGELEIGVITLNNKSNLIAALQDFEKLTTHQKKSLLAKVTYAKVNADHNFIPLLVHGVKQGLIHPEHPEVMMGVLMNYSTQPIRDHEASRDSDFFEGTKQIFSSLEITNLGVLDRILYQYFFKTGGTAFKPSAKFVTAWNKTLNNLISGKVENKYFYTFLANHKVAVKILAPLINTLPKKVRDVFIDKLSDFIMIKLKELPLYSSVYDSKLFHMIDPNIRYELGDQVVPVADIAVSRETNLPEDGSEGSDVLDILLVSSHKMNYQGQNYAKALYDWQLPILQLNQINLMPLKGTVFNKSKSFQFSFENLQYKAQVSFSSNGKTGADMVDLRPTLNYEEFLKNGKMTSMYLVGNNIIDMKEQLMDEVKGFVESQGYRLKETTPVTDFKATLIDLIANNKLDFLSVEQHAGGNDRVIGNYSTTGKLLRYSKKLKNGIEMEYLVLSPDQDALSFDFGFSDLKNAMDERSALALKTNSADEFLLNFTQCWGMKVCPNIISAVNNPALRLIGSTTTATTLVNDPSNAFWQILNGVEHFKTFPEIWEAIQKTSEYLADGSDHYLVPGTPEYKEFLNTTLPYLLNHQYKITDLATKATVDLLKPL